MISANALEPGHITAALGVKQTFVIQCLDANGQLTGAGFQSVVAYIVYIVGDLTDTPKSLICTGTSINNGLITGNYTVSDEWRVGKYNVHICVNFVPIAISPVKIDVSSRED